MMYLPYLPDSLNNSRLDRITPPKVINKPTKIAKVYPFSYPNHRNKKAQSK